MSWALLIVEDDLDIADSLRDVFLSRGFRVWSAMNGQDAIATVKRDAFRPDAILLDLLMPVMDGLAFLAARVDEPLLATTPTIVISAQLQLLGGFRDQVYGALPKPLDLQQLIEMVDRACHRLPPKP